MSENTATENLDGLIEKIRQDGVEEGKKEAADIVASAREEARVIVAEAEAEAARLMQTTQARLQHEETVARQALQRAARDVAVGLRASLRQILERLLRHECDQAFDPDTLRSLITKVAEAWMRDGGARAIDVHVSETDAEALTNQFVTRLREELGAGVEVKVHPDLQHGFAVSEVGDTMRIEFTPEATVEALLSCLNPRFAGLFDDWRSDAEAADD